ncbi:glycosyltransferase family 4 protein [Denitromonas halophila]|nr:glycosyltransferase family 4 protein [Denitromonas halophila]
MSRCLILTSEYPPFTVGGVGRYVFELASRLRHDMRVSVMVVPTYRPFAINGVTPHTPGASPNAPGLVINMAGDAYRNALPHIGAETDFRQAEHIALTVARQALEPVGHDETLHVFVQDYALALIAAALQHLRPAAHLIAACHLPVYAGFTYFDKPVGDAMHQILEAKLVQLAERVIVPSAFAANVLTLTHNVSPGKLSVLPLGAHRPSAVVPPPDEPLRLLAIGRPTEQKGYHFLFAALAQLIRDDASIRLTVVTGEKDSTRIAALARAHGVLAHVDLAPSTAPDGIWPLIDRHHLLVTTSLYETFGLAVLEAMASGRPTIGFAVGALTELWGPTLSAEFGTPVCRIDALVTRIRTLADAPEQRQRLGLAALRRAQAFSWGAHVARLSETLRDAHTQAKHGAMPCA